MKKKYMTRAELDRLGELLQEQVGGRIRNQLLGNATVTAITECKTDEGVTSVWEVKVDALFDQLLKPEFLESLIDLAQAEAKANS